MTNELWASHLYLMLSANSIRKEILQALKDHILPALWQPDLPLGCVLPPLDFPGTINARLLKATAPRRDNSNVKFPLQSRWLSAGLHSTHYPYLGFLYEGIADEKTLITAEQAKKYQLSKGIYAIRWQAPAVLLFPAGVPRGDDGTNFWESAQPTPPMKILWIDIWSEILVHTHINDGKEERNISHLLQVNDPSVNLLAGLFLQKMRDSRPEEHDSAQAILLSMMLCLQNNLQSGNAKISNRSHSAIPLATMPPDGSANEVCRDAAIYIEMHLHENLSVPIIAAQANLTPGHLNRLFQRLYGVSVMRFVRTQRIGAAKAILQSGSENIKEIAQLVGFKGANSFCKAFRIETGLTPGHYRRKTKNDKNIFPTTNASIEE